MIEQTETTVEVVDLESPACDNYEWQSVMDECSDGGRATWRMVLAPCGHGASYCDDHAGDSAEYAERIHRKRQRRKRRGSGIRCSTCHERVTLAWHRI